MAIAYQYDTHGYFIGEIEDYGRLPNNATYTVPAIQDGYIPHWTGAGWEQVENHKGERGYLNGLPYTIIDYGPYPDGWSAEPPAPTQEEEYNRRRAEVEQKYSAAWNGVSAGTLIELQMKLSAAIMADNLLADDPAIVAIKQQYQIESQNKANELTAIDQEFGVI